LGHRPPAPVGNLCSEDYFKGLGPKVRERAVKIMASVLTGVKYRGLDQPSLSRVAADKAYAMSGLEPADMDLAELAIQGNGGGIIGLEEAACPVIILERGN